MRYGSICSGIEAASVAFAPHYPALRLGERIQRVDNARKTLRLPRCLRRGSFTEGGLTMLRNWIHDSLAVPGQLHRWPAWLRFWYWVYFLTWNDWEGRIAFRTAVAVARIIA